MVASEIQSQKRKLPILHSCQWLQYKRAEKSWTVEKIFSYLNCPIGPTVFIHSLQWTQTTHSVTHLANWLGDTTALLPERCPHVDVG